MFLPTPTSIQNCLKFQFHPQKFKVVKTGQKAKMELSNVNSGLQTSSYQELCLDPALHFSTADQHRLLISYLKSHPVIHHGLPSHHICNINLKVCVSANLLSSIAKFSDNVIIDNQKTIKTACSSWWVVVTTTFLEKTLNSWHCQSKQPFKLHFYVPQKSTGIEQAPSGRQPTGISKSGRFCYDLSQHQKTHIKLELSKSALRNLTD